MRKCFVPQKQYKFVGGDYSGCELRVIAEFSQDPLWLQAFRDDGDLHSILCAKTFGIPIEDVRKPSHFKEDISYRDIQKTINFGLAYGMSEFKLSDTMEISVEEAREIIEKFFSVVPKVKEFLTKLGKLGKKHRRIRTPKPFGRIRFFKEGTIDFRDLGSIERASKNTPIQGCNADLTKLALWRCYDYLVKNNHWCPVRNIKDIFIVHTVHDEIISECKEELVEPWKEKMGEIMLNAGGEIIKSIPMKVDVDSSEYWKK